MKNKLILIGLVFTSFLDSVTTKLVLNIGGGEYNPMYNYFITLGDYPFFLFRTLIIPLIIFLIILKLEGHFKILFSVLIMTIWFYASIHNVMNL